ncbi:MAG: hypothetical protein HFH15_14345 [Ruminococcus sp.]|jgi:uncharacterized membrane protein YebE (DUF533 family)|nr:hypothetical protein [Ruminococcus sp.]
MSQEKIDRRKEEKANRKKNMAKQRRMNVLRKAVLAAAGLVLVGWLGYSAYDTYVADKNREVTVVDYNAINEYLNGLSN